MNYFHEEARELPILEADVLVAGAGTAGCIAAVAAARAGAKVILVEKMPVPSGTLSNGGNGIYSLYAEAQSPDDVRQIVKGLPDELVRRVDEAGGCDYTVNKNNPHRCPITPRFNHEVIKGVLCEMLQEAGVQVLLQTFLCGVKCVEGNIEAAFIENKSGRFAVVAKQYVDCTGDGDLAKYCGLEQTTHWQDYDKVCGGPTSLPFAMSGIDFDRAVKEMPDVLRVLGKLPKDEEGEYKPRSYFLVPQYAPERCKAILDLDLNYFTNLNSRHPGEATNINNSKGVMVDASTAEGLSSAEMEMRIRNMRFAKAMKDCLPGFENSYMIWQALQLGIRSSKITICDHMITQEEISAGARFEDEIGLYGFHDLSPKHPEYFINHEGVYGFPYRMLLPVGCKNLYMAGRCVTADIHAHMSTRNTVGCMVMGQGAGVAAALCAKKDCESRALPYAELRTELSRQGVVLDV